MRSKLCLGSSLSLLVLIFIEVQAIDTTRCDSRIPQLNGHIFTPMFDATSPFINTSVRIGVGIAQTEEVEYFAIHLGEYELLSLTGDVLFSDINVMYQQRVKDWLAMFAEYHFTARIGTEMSSLFVEGINTVHEFDVGWILKAYHSEKHILSTYFSINNLNAKFIDFTNILESISGDTLIPASRDVPALTGSVGLRYAWAPRSLIGIGLMAELSYGEALSRSTTKLFYKLGPKIDLDLSAKTRIPLGIALNYFITSAPAVVQDIEKRTQLLKLKFSYLGAGDFIIGFSTAWGKIPVNSSDEILNAFFANLEMNYYF